MPMEVQRHALKEDLVSLERYRFQSPKSASNIPRTRGSTQTDFNELDMAKKQ